VAACNSLLTSEGSSKPGQGKVGVIAPGIEPLLMYAHIGRAFRQFLWAAERRAMARGDLIGSDAKTPADDTVAESGKPYRLASRNDCAGAESTRYSRFGPSQR
jgi:hypothetical protein